MPIIDSGTDRIEKTTFTRSHLHDTSESATAVRFMKATVRIGATIGAILPLLCFVERAFRRAVGTNDGIAGWERVPGAANCTNVATAAIILSNALSRIDTDVYQRVSLQLVHPLALGGGKQQTFGLREITEATGSSSNISGSGAIEEDKDGDENESSRRSLHSVLEYPKLIGVYFKWKQREWNRSLMV